MPLSDYPIIGEEIATTRRCFLAPFANKQTGNYHTGVLIPPSLLINTKVKGIQP